MDAQIKVNHQTLCLQIY